MFSKHSTCLPQREWPRITFQAITALGSKLDSGAWKLFANLLDQETFTDQWIQTTEAKCGGSGRSPTERVLRVWKTKLAYNEDVPVDKMINVLKEMKRKDVYSIIEKMIDDGTFLDYSPTDESKVGDCFPSSPPGPLLSSGMASSATGFGGKGDESFWRPKQAPPTPTGCPVESSYRVWSGRDDLPPSSGASALAFTPHQPHARSPNSSPYPPAPQNFSKSKLSLDMEATSANSSGHHQQHPTGSTLTRDFHTWPHRHFLSRTPEGSVSSPGDGTRAYEPCHSSIAPLHSMFPENVVANAATVPAPLTNGGNCWFITYAYGDRNAAINLGFALKAGGQKVDLDVKTSSFASLEECRQKTMRVFQESSFIVVLYSRYYYNEIMGRKETSLNTRYIFQLITDEFRQMGKRNVRFVPVVGYDQIPVDPIFRNFPRPETEYILTMLGSNRHQTETVSIERTLHMSHNRRR